jgi:hypothetical protein
LPPSDTSTIVLAAARLALAAIQRPYPFHLVHLMRDGADLRPPGELYPSFHGAFDWHSAVHGHWCVARALRTELDRSFAAEAVPVLERAFAPDRLAGEIAHLESPGREGFERPYGLAWLLQLAAELRERATPEARRWAETLAPLERLAAERITGWLPRLAHPIRSGEHSQTAFALGLVLDWARGAGAHDRARAVAERARHWYFADHDAPLDWEPSGHDFLSPILGEADLMRRVLPASEFASWFARFLPDLEGPRPRRWLEPVVAADRADGKLAHLDGLNLSRAWMLEGIATALPAGERRRAVLEVAAARHRESGLASLASGHYAGTHWLGSFALYLLTRRGIAS